MNLNSFCSYRNDDVAKLVLRLMVAVLMLFHGVAKLQHGISPVIGMTEAAGLPGFFAYGAFIGEIVAPLMLLAGFRVRLASVLIIFTMLMALFIAHSGQIFSVTPYGAWALETLAFYIFSCVAIFMLGAGKYSVDKK